MKIINTIKKLFNATIRTKLHQIAMSILTVVLICTIKYLFEVHSLDFLAQVSTGVFIVFFRLFLFDLFKDWLDGSGLNFSLGQILWGRHYIDGGEYNDILSIKNKEIKLKDKLYMADNNNEGLPSSSNTQDIKYLSETSEPTHAGKEEKQLAKNLINSFQNDKTVSVDDLKRGSALTKEVEDIISHNRQVKSSISLGKDSQIIEIHGDYKTRSISARFENTDGSMAYEIVSTKTPDCEDREEFYDSQSHLWGSRGKAGPSHYIPKGEGSVQDSEPAIKGPKDDDKNEKK